MIIEQRYTTISFIGKVLTMIPQSIITDYSKMKYFEIDNLTTNLMKFIIMWF